MKHVIKIFAFLFLIMTITFSCQQLSCHNSKIGDISLTIDEDIQSIMVSKGCNTTDVISVVLIVQTYNSDLYNKSSMITGYYDVIKNKTIILNDVPCGKALIKAVQIYKNGNKVYEKISDIFMYPNIPLTPSINIFLLL